MTLLEHLQACNTMPVYDAHSDAFRSYGRFVKGDYFKKELEVLETMPIPSEGNQYIPSVKELEIPEIKAKIEKELYGGMEIQIGYCNGRNSTINGFEYHKGSEINAAACDFVLALGHVWEIDDLHYDISKAKLFLFRKGDVFEMYQTTLHLSPIKVCDEGFRDLVVLPKGTNTDLETEKTAHPEDPETRLLIKKNKWVISHPDRKPLIDQGAYPGVMGENYELKY